jgi:cell wall-associated NlpC family hydrolase
MSPLLQRMGGAMARYLTKSRNNSDAASVTDPDRLRRCLRPGDVLLVEGTSRVSSAIKYLTQSTWSHVALYVGDAFLEGGDDPRVLIEADMVEGVVAIPLSRYHGFNTRIARPFGMSDHDLQQVIDHALSRLGHDYDLRNIFDLMRFLLPLPFPQRLRRRMIAFGSGDPTRAICSGMIADAFQQVRYPILPRYHAEENDLADSVLLQQRHYSHFMPRDFDLSPYFAVVKPSLQLGFDYKSLRWADLHGAPETAETAPDDSKARPPAD